MDANLLGSLFGRLLFSYLFVWLVLFIFSRFKYSLAVSRTHSVGGVGAVLVVFLLPLAAQYGAML